MYDSYMKWQQRLPSKNSLGHKDLSIKYRDQVANQGGTNMRVLKLVGKLKAAPSKCK